MAIEIINLTAGYNKKPVLKDINICLERGRVCALLGHNGSGKTTLMYCINAIMKPHSGSIKIMGDDISKLNRVDIATRCSIVPQSNYAAIDFSVTDMILMGSAARLKAWSSPGQKELKKAYAVMEEIGIESMAESNYNELSGGQKQMVLFARALYQDTPLMLLDEPNSHLDFCKQHKLMKITKDLVKKRGVTALISLHDPNLALYYCDDVIMMENGRVIAAGPVSETINNDNLRKALGKNIKIDNTRDGLPVVVPCSYGQYDLRSVAI